MTEPMQGLDVIRISGVAGYGYHGVLPEERRLGQRFVVDVELGLQTDAAAAADDLSRTVDYGTVAEQVHDRIEGDPVDLLETLASLIVADCLAHEAVQSAVVTVHKPQAPVRVPFSDISLRVSRSR